MFEEFVKDVFGTKTFNDLWEDLFNKEFSDVEEDGKVHSYTHTVKDKYENGEHVLHFEKETKDGKVIKDINTTFGLEDKEKETDNRTETYKCEDGCTCKKEKNNELVKIEKEKVALKQKCKILEQSLRSAENALIEKDEKITELQVTNKELLGKIAQIKDIFAPEKK